MTKQQYNMSVIQTELNIDATNMTHQEMMDELEKSFIVIENIKSTDQFILIPIDKFNEYEENESGDKLIPHNEFFNFPIFYKEDNQ